MKTIASTPRPPSASWVSAGSRLLSVSMLLLLVPLYALYEFALLAIRVTHWRAARRAAAASDTAA